MEKTNLLSYELENLTLSDMRDLDEAIIDTPNLRPFKLIDMEKVPSWCPVVGSRLLEVEIGLKNARTTNSLLELREVKSHSKNLCNNIGPLCIKHMTLEVLSLLVPRYESLMNKLFSYFHPRTLLVRVDSDAQSCNFIQLKGQKTNRSKRYKSSDYMYWRNALKSFEILESTITTTEGAHRLSLELHWYLLVMNTNTGIPQVT
ncbi:hypothetical protein H5410_025819 [Solanum commersonii]|uniref:Uncharacterized protein n=1 Tax=Solanum commersonii TaxID=4109 RepID=A0A9J5YX40_SOLCO|nr:hypothetical protein H5410_025819 [Solanum commersonii]